MAAVVAAAFAGPLVVSTIYFLVFSSDTTASAAFSLVSVVASYVALATTYVVGRKLFPKFSREP